MLKRKEKISNLFEWLVDKFQLIQFKLHTIFVHKPTMIYLGIRNYTWWTRIPSDKVNNRTDIIWELRKPLTITYITEDRDYCPTCHKRAVDDGEYCQSDYHEFNHAQYHHWYERNIFSKELKYSHTSCTCEKLLFEPLEEYYGSGGESGSALFTQDCAQWKINKEKGYDLNPLKRHKKQLLPRDWSRYDN